MLWMGIWMHLYTVTPVQVGGGFVDNWGMAEPEWCCNVMIDAPNPMDWIPHPYHIYTKCFSTLICCEWAYGCTLTLLCLCRSGVDFWKFGWGWARVMLQCHGWGSKPPWTVSHIHIKCIQSVLAAWYAVDGHMGAPLHCYACKGRGLILGKLG
jgi:hypothetical protein